MFKSPKSREKGKIVEFQVMSKLIALGLDLYVPILDTGIDCITRIEKHGEPVKYYDLQIKSALYRNVSIRGAKRIIEYIDKRNPDNYFLIIAIRENDEIKHVIYLTTEQIRRYEKVFPKVKEIDINIPARDRGLLIKSQSLDHLITKLKS